MTKNKWYQNTDFVSKLKQEFEKAGLPLEYKARKIFEKKGFDACEDHYKYPNDHVFDINLVEKEGTWRQIDIDAIPNGKNGSIDFDLKFESFRLTLTPNFIGECKFSSNKSFFLFKSENRYVNFPATDLGNNLLPLKLSLHDPEDESLFSECFKNVNEYFNISFYENIVEVDIDHLEKKDNNYNDQITYRACEQLYNAVNYKIFLNRSEAYDVYWQVIESELSKKWFYYINNSNLKKEDIITSENKVLDSVALKFLKENFNLNDIQNIFHLIFVIFPVLIINEESGLFEVIIDQKGYIQGFEKIKYGFYNYNTSECYSHHRCVLPDNLGIIICDVSYLDELIDTVIEGFKKIGQKLEENLNKWPFLLGYELLFNQELIDPNVYFLKPNIDV